MASSTPLDSATALARTPLFSGLGRVDLAKLAGELEELSFEAGRLIVREGDPPDGFYVINAGRVRVVTGARPVPGPGDIRLGSGEGFGEMALLSDSPRTASVLADTDTSRAKGRSSATPRPGRSSGSRPSTGWWRWSRACRSGGSSGSCEPRRAPGAVGHA
jgi:hypothetical protein